MTASSVHVATQLESIVGRSHIKSSPEECAAYSVDNCIPGVVAAPASAHEVSEIVRFAAKENLAVIACGSRSKLNIGKPPARYDIALDMTSLNQIAHYDPADLTLSVEAGMSLATLSTALFEQKQFLPLAVPFADRSTVGGAIASGLDSPLRQLYGTARDFIIGAEFVTGSGALTKSGGRVVKNVTGYDLHKLLIGSLGTLAVITRINFRTFPLPLDACGFLASYPSAAGALALRDRIANSPLAPSTFEIVSPRFPHLFPDADLWHVCVGFAGTAEVSGRVSRDLLAFAAETNSVSAQILEDQACFTLWQQIREAIPNLLSASPAMCIFKIAQLPGELPKLFSSLAKIELPSVVLAGGSGAFYYGFCPASPDLQLLSGTVASIFEICSEQNATSALLWCPTELKKHQNIWGQPRQDDGLMKRLKFAFDPQNILAPGRY